MLIAYVALMIFLINYRKPYVDLMLNAYVALMLSLIISAQVINRPSRKSSKQ